MWLESSAYTHALLLSWSDTCAGHTSNKGCLIEVLQHSPLVDRAPCFTSLHHGMSLGSHCMTYIQALLWQVALQSVNIMSMQLFCWYLMEPVLRTSI
jgi:hypothetical protein